MRAQVDVVTHSFPYNKQYIMRDTVGGVRARLKMRLRRIPTQSWFELCGCGDQTLTKHDQVGSGPNRSRVPPLVCMSQQHTFRPRRRRHVPRRLSSRIAWTCLDSEFSRNFSSPSNPTPAFVRHFVSRGSAGQLSRGISWNKEVTGVRLTSDLASSHSYVRTRWSGTTVAEQMRNAQATSAN
ncbi:hypothetical protein BC834DRAFT_321376 [Gloeopeniophorella convolvens]|nr:hypothetical protein BC834DRAFT_321376 [Gloeopeniophorella convolvens]